MLPNKLESRFCLPPHRLDLRNEIIERTVYGDGPRCRGSDQPVLLRKMKNGRHLQAIRPPIPRIKIPPWIKKVIVINAVFKRKSACHHGCVGRESMRRKNSGHFFYMSTFESHSFQVRKVICREVVGFGIEKYFRPKTIYRNKNNARIGGVSFRPTARQKENGEE